MHLSIELYFLNEKKLTLHTPKTEGRGGGVNFAILQFFICKFKKMFAARKSWGLEGWPLPDSTCLIVMSDFAKKRGGEPPAPPVPVPKYDL